ncbi:PTS sugar transporter subunit IIA [Salmonella enterica]|nr:PTS sugar transporter subunit IIA [Salmonella enterica subsp. enterica serovar Poona]EHX7008925.1 PTS sugar transporter subunit IIA [Salmonella enterica subsp. enterica serovar Concord]EIC0165226.1 PTS sugar transporter subunit IIA [Salmonella enterica subsp. enterica serovar Kinondoni]MKU04173.1 PTS sugar transporter subunit IIA [Salmonella enterica subsp. enterica serovar Kinondoni]
MRKFLFASHGRFADGIKDSLEMVVGKNEAISTLCAYTEDVPDLKASVQQFFSTLTSQDEVIVITDISRGSVNNEFISYLQDQRLHLISGLNLPLLISLILESPDISNTKELVRTAIREAKDTIQYYNDTLLTSQHNADEF